MAKKVKVFNRNKFNVGIILMDGIRQMNINPNSFVIIDEDEVYYINSISSLFRKSILTVEDEEVNLNLGFVEKNPNVITEQEIEELLKGNHLKMKKNLGMLTEKHVKDRVYEVAKKIAKDLTGAKLKFIEEFTGKTIEVENIENDDK